MLYAPSFKVYALFTRFVYESPNLVLLTSPKEPPLSFVDSSSLYFLASSEKASATDEPFLTASLSSVIIDLAFVSASVSAFFFSSSFILSVTCGVIKI